MGNALKKCIEPFLRIFEKALKIKNCSNFTLALVLRKILVLEIKKTPTNKTFMTPRHNFNAHVGVYWSNFIKQKACFEIFSRFNRNQIYIFFSFLQISLATHLDFRNCHQLFYNRPDSYKLFVLYQFPFLFFVYRCHRNIDYLENHI